MPTAEQIEAIRSIRLELERPSAIAAAEPKSAAAAIIDSHIDAERLARAMSEVASGEFDAQS